jgi:hypothetical protein
MKNYQQNPLKIKDSPQNKLEILQSQSLLLNDSAFWYFMADAFNYPKLNL